MYYCPSFTEDDIPDRLWQEAEYGIKQSENGQVLEDILNNKVFKTVEILIHPGIRQFFEFQKDKSGSTDRLTPNTRKAADSLSNLIDDRSSTASNRWQAQLLRKKGHSSVRLAFGTGLISKTQTADAFSDKQQYGDKMSNINGHNNTHSVIHQEDALAELRRQDTGDAMAAPVMRNIMGFTNESPLDQNFLRKDKDNSLPSNSPLNYDF